MCTMVIQRAPLSSKVELADRVSLHVHLDASIEYHLHRAGRPRAAHMLWTELLPFIPFKQSRQDYPTVSIMPQYRVTRD